MQAIPFWSSVVDRLDEMWGMLLPFLHACWYICIYVCVSVYSFIHTCIHTCIHAYIHRTVETNNYHHFYLHDAMSLHISKIIQLSIFIHTYIHTSPLSVPYQRQPATIIWPARTSGSNPKATWLTISTWKNMPATRSRIYSFQYADFARCYCIHL